MRILLVVVRSVIFQDLIGESYFGCACTQLIPGHIQVRLVERHQELGGEPRALGAVLLLRLFRVGGRYDGREDDEEEEP